MTLSFGDKHFTLFHLGHAFRFQNNFKHHRTVTRKGYRITATRLSDNRFSFDIKKLW